MQSKSVLDMTNGPFLKKIFLFAMPLVFTGLLQIFYNTADVVVVGRFAGSESLAAVGATGPLVNLILNVFMGLSMGSGVMTARHIGARDDERTENCVHTAMLISVFAGITVSIIGFFCSKTMLGWMNAPEDVIDLSSLYLKIYFLGSPGSLIFNFGASIVRAMGDTRRPLYYLGSTGLVNIALNLVLVIVFNLGVAGVAIATITAQYLSAIMIVIRMTRLDNACRLKFKNLRIHTKELAQIVRIGLPAGLQNSMFSISNVIIQSTINSFGSVAMAGITAGSNYDGYIYVCTNALAQTTMTFTSQNIGAKKYENTTNVFRYCIFMTAVISVVMSVLGIIAGKAIVGMFSNKSEVIAIGVQRLRLVMPFYCFCSLMDVTAGQLRGMGRSTQPAIISLLGVCGLRLAWIFFVLPHNHTLMTLYWAYPVSWAGTFFAQILYYAYANWSIKRKVRSRTGHTGGAWPHGPSRQTK